MRWKGTRCDNEDNRIPKQVFLRGTEDRKACPRHKPRKRSKDNVKNNLNTLHMNVQHWKELI